MTQQNLVTSGIGRVWIQPRGCNTPMLYAGCYGLGDVTIPEGDVTYVRCPSPSQANVWDIVGSVVGTPGNKTTSMQAPIDLVNYLLTIKCDFNFQFRMGECSRPDDPAGWESLLAFEGARITNRGVQNLNPRDPANNNQIMTTADITFSEMYFVKEREFVAKTVTATSGATMQDIHFCDAEVCAGACGTGSIGCQVGYVITSGIAAGEEIWKTIDGGANWTELTNPFTSIYDDLVAIDCIDDVVILINGTSTSSIARSADGGTTWAIIDVGGAQIVNDIFIADSANMWLVGDGGYVWYSSDGGLTWETQDAGVATSENLAEVFFYTTQKGIAVGAAGAIIRTIDGGVTWTAVTSGTANALNTVCMSSELIAWVGGASGTLLYTMDGGLTWTAKTWPGAATDTINAITFCGCEFGFFGSTTIGTLGKLYTTLDGGYTYRLETLPTNLGINAIHCCDPNTVYLATNGDGKILKTT